MNPHERFTVIRRSKSSHLITPVLWWLARWALPEMGTHLGFLPKTGESGQSFAISHSGKGREMVMKIKLDYSNTLWWFWPITLVLMIAAIIGWPPGYYVVIFLSAIQVILFLVRERNVMAFPSQVRIVYFALTLFGLWAAGRLYVYLLLILGTFMVVFFSRCSISLLLKAMPWNRTRTARLYWASLSPILEIENTLHPAARIALLFKILIANSIASTSWPQIISER